ncbi:MAG TPA: alpha/beta hydrolase [Candidatus Binatia bacterium]|jgi:pimeloyl-ACP methyl ester carboxylesterase
MPIVKRDGAEIYFEVHGRGTPLMFFSETACDGEVWKLFQVAEFSRDHMVITHDYRGTGRSTKPGRHYSTEDFVDDAVAILDHLDAGPAIVCGHSMGGRVIQLMALKHPAKITRLIIASSGSGHPGMTGIPITMCKEMVELGYEKYVREHALEVGWTKAYIERNRDRVDHFLEVRMRNLPPLESYLRHVIARQEHDTTDRLNRIAAPTLILVGSDDHASATGRSHRDDAELLARDIPNSRLTILEGEAHNYFFTNPADAHRAIREFLAES